MQLVIPDFAIENLREVHLHQQTENQRKIVQTVGGQFRRLIHAPKLTPNNSKCPVSFPGNQRSIVANGTGTMAKMIFYWPI
jgi:hypothetical protein